MTTKPGTSGTSKKGTSKVTFKKTGNPVWDAYGKAWETETNAGRTFSVPQGLGRGTISGLGTTVPIKTKKKKDDKKKVLSNSHISSNKGNNDADKAVPRPEFGLYKWNLPPHTWSLPVKPSTQNDIVYSAGDVEQYRRGRLWWYASLDSTMYVNGKDVTKKTLEERAFGFQFLWNPDSYTTNVAVNMDVYPNPLDKWSGAAGYYPSGESISFTLRLDRTNDFAAARHLLQKNYASTPKFKTTGPNMGDAIYEKGTWKDSTTDATALASLSDYYTTGLGSDTADAKLEKIKTLLEVGTLSDIEYLFKAINGDRWVNAAGRSTSDIGYLAATLLRVDIGPVSYIGYVGNLSINHVGFSQDMTPIRTDVSISMELMSSAGQKVNEKKAGTS